MLFQFESTNTNYFRFKSECIPINDLLLVLEIIQVISSLQSFDANLTETNIGCNAYLIPQQSPQ